MRRGTILAVLALSGIGYVYSVLALSPVLLQIADEFRVTVGQAGLAVASYGVPGVVLSVVAGPFADRYGRKRFLVLGNLVLGGATVAAALAPTFTLLVVARGVAGIGAAMAAASLMATVADHFGPSDRGRAIGVVVGATSITTLAGVPVAGVLADATTWRVSLSAVGVVAVLAAVLVMIYLPASGQFSVSDSGARAPHRLVIRHRPTLVLFVVAFFGGLPWSIWVAFIVVFFQTTYGVTQAVASIVTLTTGVGMFVGTQLGGRLGDRVGHRWMLRITLVGLAVMIGVLMILPLALAAVAACNVVYTAFYGARTVSQNALLVGQIPNARATVMAILSAVNVGAQALAGVVGGFVIDHAGFSLLGVFCVLSTAVAAATLWLYGRGRAPAREEQEEPEHAS